MSRKIKCEGELIRLKMMAVSEGHPVNFKAEAVGTTLNMCSRKMRQPFIWQFVNTQVSTELK
jgi:hypothetical protein